jgi:hypothetical protein
MANVKPKPKTKGKKEKPKVSRTRKPPEMSLDEWQVHLRKQFGAEQKFHLARLGDHPIFSDFDVTNPQSGNTYKVRVRGAGVGDNACSCPDFATNTLGTCKHIEFTLARLKKKGANRRQLREGFQPPHSEIFLQYGSRREVHFRPGSECPVELARLAAGTFDEAGVLRSEGVAHFETFLQKAGEIEPGLDCGDDVLAYIAELRDAERRKELVAKEFPRGIRSAAFKDIVKATLYDYQREGALFAARAGRCLIGDEMGLGKTIQALTAAEIMAKLFGVERVLIVCPTSLKHQWSREIERFTNRVAHVITGESPARRAQFAEQGHFFKIMNYDTVHRDLDAINGWSPDLVILDEAQRIKNWTTRTARSVKKIASPYAIVLTGTPLENRLEELVSIVQFVDLFRLGPTFRLLDAHQVRDEVGKVIGYKELDKLGQTLAPLLLRRQKSQVLEQLPGRIDTNIFVPMTPQQRKIHAEQGEIVARIVMKWRRYGFLTEADQRRLMCALQNMRMVCDSSYLVDSATEFGTKADEAATLIGEMMEKPGAKVVVFSAWLKMHELLIRRLKDRDIGHVFFHGGVPGAKRKDLVERFRDDAECRVFLATDAGGVGLNLQHASIVVNMDLPWNPAVLEQRVGRVHRLGQKQPVQVVNFIARGGIEEGMLSLLKFKTSLFKGVLDGGDKEVFLGGSRLKRFMDSVDAATTAIPDVSAEKEDPPEEPAAREPVPEAAKPTTVIVPAPTAPVPANPWAGLLETGLALMMQLAAQPVQAAEGQPRSLIQRDERTGETYLRLPAPPPEVVEQLLGGLQKLLEGFRR